MAKKKAKKSTKKAKHGSKKSRSRASKPDDDFYNRQQEALNKSRSGGQMDFWKPESGDNELRPLTFVSGGRKELLVTDAKHWFEGEEGGRASVRCPCDDTCPVCDLKGEVSAKVWDSIKPSAKVMMNAVVRGRRVDKMVVAQLAPSAANGVLKAVQDASKLGTDILNPDKGRDVVITKSGEGFQTRYKVSLGGDDPLEYEGEPADLLALVVPADPDDLMAVARKLAKLK